MPSRRVLYVLIGLAALTVGAALNLWLNRPAPETRTGVAYPEPRPLADFHLTDHDGTAFTRDRLQGKWTFLYFGYTFCPDVCPLTLVELDKTQQALAAAGLDDDNQYWFISVDPQRDTPARLGEYSRYFNPKFGGATGADDELTAFTRQVGVLYLLVKSEEESDTYLVDHSSVVVLIDPDARLYAAFPPPHDGPAMAEDFRTLRAQWVRERS